MGFAYDLNKKTAFAKESETFGLKRKIPSEIM
jgi:hypothetical protein